MYNPPAFREDRLEVLHKAIRDHPLGALITYGPSGLVANLVPFTLHSSPGGHALRAHMARANEQIDDLRQQAPTLVIFQGPQAYVSPSWYPTKKEHGKVVPTWNYIMVQVRGAPRIIEDSDWILAQIGDLTSRHEGERGEPWNVSDAPPSFVNAQLKGILGLEIGIEQIQGKWKISQNQPERNRAGVAAGLDADGFEDLALLVSEGIAPV
jgi:transcriptional regulator